MIIQQRIPMDFYVSDMAVFVVMSMFYNDGLPGSLSLLQRTGMLRCPAWLIPSMR